MRIMYPSHLYAVQLNLNFCSNTSSFCKSVMRKSFIVLSSACSTRDSISALFIISPIKSQEESINFRLTFYTRSQRSGTVHIIYKFAIKQTWVNKSRTICTAFILRSYCFSNLYWPTGVSTGQPTVLPAASGTCTSSLLKFRCKALLRHTILNKRCHCDNLSCTVPQLLQV